MPLVVVVVEVRAGDMPRLTLLAGDIPRVTLLAGDIPRVTLLAGEIPRAPVLCRIGDIPRVPKRGEATRRAGDSPRRGGVMDAMVSKSRLLCPV
mmetsp:Transcript_45122/g.109177  ORF Transcript_45122/g.109177 Transcript_45122/m.109177 type:complete len:94 (-) Transcript_45122:2745-3026(-)